MQAILMLIAAVTTTSVEPAADFDNQIIPVLTKAGCNTGACHGAAVGRGGFKLSLYGGDPELDYRSIVLELEGRRINLTRPAESLLILKPTESISHGGGTRLEYEGTGANLLERWIREGARRNQSKQLQEFQVSPRSQVVERIGESIPLSATARFSDGSTVDVTRWTVFTPEDPAAVEVDPETASARLLRRGRQIVVARYLDRVVPIELLVPLSDEAVDLSNESRKDFIDEQILDVLSTLRLPVSPAADDATFLRRITLDLTGRLPTFEQTSAFLTNHNPDKRTELIDRLLASDEFNEFWTLQLARLFRIRSQAGDKQAALTYHTWLKAQIANRTPYDQIARQMLTATGDTHEYGPVNFYRTVGGPREQAEFTSELFMGNRLRCANCHNHPLDRWTQDDYHGLSAIFAKLERGRVIEVATSGEVIHPRTGEAAVPRIPGEYFLETSDDGRTEFADWLTNRDNPYFAKAIVNRLWKAMLGRGLVEPTDDLRDTNPATHPALLEQLATDFVEHGYDLRHTLRLIAQSAAYSRSAQTLTANQSDDRYYSHALTRPLSAEVLADAIADITGIADRYEDQPAGTRAVTLFDPQIKSETLDILGRCDRTESCETGDEATGGLTRQLHLFNGPLLNRRVTDPEGRLTQLMADEKPPAEIITEFYLRALNRPPSSQEQEFWNQQLSAAESPQQQRELLEDFVWSLLTCREFITNH
ncbi:MAG TPA: DUF1549 and DUF1553 domain-containing protein [Planctomycetaceae bacterium]|nr:DUF1549 and DUF1553 domain-containing protein [Planctomycetaceae bacterium]